MKAIKTLLFTGYGINSEHELAECFKRAGSQEVVIRHVNEIIQDPSLLNQYDVLAIAGGFSYGDHLGSGRMFANKLRWRLYKELHTFAMDGKPIIGICNGFQVLACLDFLPFLEKNPTQGERIQPAMTLTDNQQGLFEDRWVRLLPNQHNTSFWLKNLPDDLPVPVRHGEGRCYFRSKAVLQKVITKKIIAFQYRHDKPQKTMRYPHNPNGSPEGIAGLTNETGNLLGLMPHPEVFMIREQYPKWRQYDFSKLKTQFSSFTKKDGLGMLLFYNAIRYMRGK